jgi:hypothetical protein
MRKLVTEDMKFGSALRAFAMTDDVQDCLVDFF